MTNVTFFATKQEVKDELKKVHEKSYFRTFDGNLSYLDKLPKGDLCFLVALNALKTYLDTK
jgi:hypothetical protein